MPVLVTGAAGFIGYHVAQALLTRGEDVIGIDNFSPYYDVQLKQARLARLLEKPGFRFHRLDITDKDATAALFAGAPEIDRIVHLAAQPGVRHSLADPYTYVNTNVLGQLVVLEAARRLPRLHHLLYASSSSVYGESKILPFSEDDRADAPNSLYAATKRAGELVSHVYRHLFALPQTGLRFFTVYGPWGRPDMAYYSFALAIVSGQPITLYNGGALKRDFTYIDDIVAGVLACLDRPPAAGEPARLLNIGNHHAEEVRTLVALLEQGLGRKAVIQHAPRPALDVPETFASIDRLQKLTGFAPHTPLAEGIARFLAWFKSWHNIH
jgi:UDP-glucuronate 4-epimerase